MTRECHVRFCERLRGKFLRPTHHFGMKAHIGVDADSGLVHSVTTTAANEADVEQVADLLHGKEEQVWADSGSRGSAVMHNRSSGGRTNLTSSTQAERIGMAIAAAATPVLKILEVGGRAWKRNVPEKDGRHGPWLPASWQVLDEKTWTRRTGSLYLVVGLDGCIRYVGISRNRVADRWRLSPAVDAETMKPLAGKQLFHSQCWPHLQRERGRYEIRAISGDELVPVLEQLGPPVSGFTALRGDPEGIAASVERWLCNHQSERLVSWNTAMTAKRKV